MDLYSLKRQHPANIDLYQKTTYAPNYVTGSQGIQQKTINLPFSIALPRNVNFENITHHHSNNQTFIADQTFIIDANDLPDNWEVSLTDWVIFNNKRYDVVKLQVSSECNGIILYTKQVNMIVPKIINQNVIDYVRLSVSASSD